MSMADKVHTVVGDLLDLRNCNNMIIQQLNCLSVQPKGLSAIISKALPYANVYAGRTREGRKNLAVASDRDVPGTINISIPPSDAPASLPIVAGIFGQFDVGKAGKTGLIYRSRWQADRPSPQVPETSQQREVWFQQGLDRLVDWIIANNKNNKDFIIGVPYKIGCGLAGGNWDNYYAMLVKFIQRLECQLVIYHKK